MTGGSSVSVGLPGEAIEEADGHNDRFTWVTV
jgi:hypothetical protein